MYTLGYSGFNNAIAFKKQSLPHLTEVEYRICQGMDAAAVLLHDGEVIAAAAEERFVNAVHTGQFPIHAIQYCLQAAQIVISDVSAICHGFHYDLYKDLFCLDTFTQSIYENVYASAAQKKLFRKHFPELDIDKLFTPIRHHDAHAASTYFMSGFDDALVFIADGLGESDSISIYHGIGNELKPLYRYDISSSLGIFYMLLTMHLGFEPNNDEYKIMGLAPYGDADRFKTFFTNCINITADGQMHIPLIEKNKDLLEKQTYRGSRQWLSDALVPERKPHEPVRQIHMDIAAGLQNSLQNTICSLIQYWQSKINSKNLCMAGGVALNCTANGKLLEKKLFDNIYIQPAAGDDGSALGAALYKHHIMDGHTRNNKTMKNPLPLYGPEFTDQEILEELEKHSDVIQFDHLDEASLIAKAAQLLNEENIIGWMQGRMEFGPRALGNRSILANPLVANMKDRVNKTIKRREEFRPFAPSVIAEEAHTYFDIPRGLQLPYMLCTVQVREEYRAKLPAITHVDGSARLQTVDKNQHEKYWQLLNAFKQQSGGYPILLNTSFNVKGQPIVRTPKDAIETYLSTELDYLFIGNFFARKQKNVS